MSVLLDFYEIKNFREEAAGNYVATIRLNPDHAIFKGHFPGNPVTPGVCMMQIIKDLTEQVAKRSLFLSRSSNVKFMALINPEENPELEVQLAIAEDEQGQLKVKNITTFGETVALKLTNVYINK